MIKRDSLMYASQIKRATLNMINGVNDYFKHNFKHDSVLSHVSDTNDFNANKKEIKYADNQIKHNHGLNQIKYENALTNLYRKFDFHFVNKVAHDDSSFQMLGRRLYNAGTDRSNQPIQFGNLDLDTSKRAEHQFIKGEDKANRAFSGHQYSLFRHPSAYKKHLLSNMKHVQSYISKHPWKRNQVPSKLFNHQPTVMRTLGVSDQHYYENAIKKQTGQHVRLPKGVYSIEYGSDIDSKHPENYRVSAKQFHHLLNDFMRHSSMMTGEDLRDSYLGYSHELDNSTTADFKPTDYSKYGKPVHSFAHLYRTLHDPKISTAFRMSKATDFFNHYPKFANQVNIYSGKQAKRQLHHKINGLYRDGKAFAHFGLSNINKEQIHTYTHKLHHINDNFIYTGEQLSRLKPQADHLNLKALSQNVFAVLPYKQQKSILKVPTRHKMRKSAGKKWNNLITALNKVSTHHKITPKSHHKSRSQTTKRQRFAQLNRGRDFSN